MAFNEHYVRFLQDGAVAFVTAKLPCDEAVRSALGSARTRRTLLDVLWDVHEADTKGVCGVRLCAVPVDVPAARTNEAGESQTHRSLKRCAARWLRSLGHADADEEIRYPPGRADAGSRSANIAVECGRTKARRIIKAVAQGWSVVWVRYDAPIVNGQCATLSFSSPVANKSHVALRKFFTRVSAEDLRRDYEQHRAAVAAARLSALSRLKPALDGFDRLVAAAFNSELWPEIMKLTDVERGALHFNARPDDTYKINALVHALRAQLAAG